MKIIDKTPLQDENGEISFNGRIQGTLKYGLSWYNDLQAQKMVIAQLERMLEKGYVLIRNFTLPGSDIVIPMTLIGPGGTYIISVTNVKGFFEAKGDQWNEVKNGRSQPSGINLLGRVVKLSKAFQVFLQKQNINLPGTVEPVLITVNPGAHVDSVRPVARVVKSDAIKQFGAAVIQARPVMRNEQIYDIGDRIVDPRPPSARAAAVAPPPASEPSRAKAIFNSPQTATPFEASSMSSDMNFSFDEDAASKSSTPAFQESNPAQPLKNTPAAAGRRIWGMSVMQFIIIAVLFLMALCVVLVAAYVIVILPSA